MKLASLNVGSMTGRSGEIVQLMRKKSLQLLCVQETKWKGSKAREIGAGCKLYYHGEYGTKNGVGIVLSEYVRDRVLAVERTCDRVMRMKLEIEGEVWHIISCYAPQGDAHKWKKMSSGSTWTQICKRYQEARGWSWREI